MRWETHQNELSGNWQASSDLYCTYCKCIIITIHIGRLAFSFFFTLFFIPYLTPVTISWFWRNSHKLLLKFEIEVWSLRSSTSLLHKKPSSLYMELTKVIIILMKVVLIRFAWACLIHSHKRNLRVIMTNDEWVDFTFTHNALYEYGSN